MLCESFFYHSWKSDSSKISNPNNTLNIFYSIPSKVWASGRGLQPNGIRVNETVDFKVYTEGAGEGKVGVKIIGPGGIDLDYISRSVDPTTTEFTYTPKVQKNLSKFLCHLFISSFDQQPRHIVFLLYAFGFWPMQITEWWN
jgi:hypothetical protein